MVRLRAPCYRPRETPCYRRRETLLRSRSLHPVPSHLVASTAPVCPRTPPDTPPQPSSGMTHYASLHIRMCSHLPDAATVCTDTHPDIPPSGPLLWHATVFVTTHYNACHFPCRMLYSLSARKHEPGCLGPFVRQRAPCLLVTVRSRALHPVPSHLLVCAATTYSKHAHRYSPSSLDLWHISLCVVSSVSQCVPGNAIY